jgi:hypothetical protein
VTEATLEGSLAELTLPDVLQLLSIGAKTGAIHLSHGSEVGEIYLEEGQIVHAEGCGFEGEEAAYRLAGWMEGRFRFEAGPAAPAHTISKSNTALLMEAARRSDEWAMISSHIPSTQSIPAFVVPEGSDESEGQINLNTREWQILSKIDGKRDINQIAAASGLSSFDAAKLLYSLVATGLIRLREPGSPAG